MNRILSEFHLTNSLLESVDPRFLHFRTRGSLCFTSNLGAVDDSTDRIRLIEPQFAYNFSMLPNNFSAYDMGLYRRRSTSATIQVLRIYFYCNANPTRNVRKQNYVNGPATTPDKSLNRRICSYSLEESLMKILQYKPSLIRYSYRPIALSSCLSHIWQTISMPTCLSFAPAVDPNIYALLCPILSPPNQLPVRDCCKIGLSRLSPLNLDGLTGKTRDSGTKIRQKLENFGICESVGLFRNGLNSFSVKSKSLPANRSADQSFNSTPYRSNEQPNSLPLISPNHRSKIQSRDPANLEFSKPSAPLGLSQ